MSWMAKLYETYEHGQVLDLPDEQQLIPIGHVPQNAHIKITIDGDGNYLRAQVLEKTQIILPASEASAGRSGKKPPPHPLADKLQYVAGDYSQRGGKKPAFFDEYLQQLQAWCESEHATNKVRAVLRYVARGKVIQNLLDDQIILVDEAGNLLTTLPNQDKDVPALVKTLPKKTGGIFEQGDALVCWSVEIPGDPVADTWKDKETRHGWVEYLSTQEGQTGYCFATGKDQLLASRHPAKLRHSGDKAKLISANDMDGFTFRGRFTDSKKSVDTSGYQSLGVGFDVTQKAHIALAWLIARQGFRNSNQIVVCWAVSGKPVPDPTMDSFALLGTDLDGPEAAASGASELDHGIDLGESFAKRLISALTGYKAKLSPTESIIVMGLESATEGRMGITYYRDKMAHEFIDVVGRWHLDTAWWQRTRPGKANKTKDTGPRWLAGSPSIYAIIRAAYGRSAADALKINLVKRLLPCITEGSPLPFDVVNSAVQSACNRSAKRLDDKFSNRESEYAEWERHLGVACALYRGFYARHPDQSLRRSYDMALEEDNHKRDYLYGRLLAVADRIEQVALFVADEKRATTAERLMQRFANRPYSTWRTIELSLSPYLQRLRSKRAGFLTNRNKDIDAILNSFVGDDFTSDKPLSGEFLLGFHCQRLALRQKAESDTEAKTNPEQSTEH